jgi:peroxiredoxin/predicted negative regulator of RcsB-dependent stress response
MRFTCVILALACYLTPVLAQEKTDGPTDEKARKTYEKALKSLHERNKESALDAFKKADKQDGGHCLDCQIKMIKYGVDLGEWKTAELGAEEMLAGAKSERDTAVAHYQFAVVLLDEGLQKRKDELFTRAHEESAKALAAYANFPDALWMDGTALAHLRQDDAAKTRFEQYVKMRPADDPKRQRALRYISRPELVRAKMAPPFALTDTDGQRISMDELQGKVVLLDFWATWCVPCREALPHIREVAKKFQGQPLVILSVSLDSDEQKWKEFIGKNEMTWPQYRDGGFTGPIAKMFAVNAIPHTFTIDADGVLQDEHIGDASIEGKLKKLLARARELQPTEIPPK